MQYREIPYNYSSFSDQEIVCRFLGEKSWKILQSLRNDRNTGRSARMLFEVLGDIWVVERNPYLQEDLINNTSRLKKLIIAMNYRISQIESRADNDDRIYKILKKTKYKITDFERNLSTFRVKKRTIFKALNKVTNKNNIRFDPLSRASHATDATDWRVEYPLLVITPDYENEVQDIIKTCISLGLNIIPRGGGTGYTGACVPLTKNSVIINTEKLMNISSIYKKNGGNVISVGSGVITATVAEAAKKHNLIFAVDPTSMSSSTIGGNISMNAGGKKALRWGTTIDNLLSWKMVDANGSIIEITRLNHNFDKIQLLDEIEFEINQDNNQEILTIQTKDIRKQGLGKDVTNKFMSGLPGVQKEGCDGIIISAEFILHKPLKNINTLCLEFFGFDSKSTVQSIVAIKELIDNNKNIELVGMEHLDYRYIKAVGYSTKANKFELPRMLLLIDISSSSQSHLDKQNAQIAEIINTQNAQVFIAIKEMDRQIFWKDRSNTAAIAAHTNAFKVNEDVVIPLKNLAEYNDGIEQINIRLSIENKIQLAIKIQEYLKSSKIDKLEASINLITEVISNWQEYLKDDEVIHKIQIKELIVSYKEEIKKPLFNLFTGNNYQNIRENIELIHRKILKTRIFIALHMHAGDGNVHTNIPVHSHSRPMLKRVDEIVDEIMLLATSLDGVISGEHGIGITKYKYLSDEFKQDFVLYKKKVDKNNNFNTGKLMPGSGLQNAYTPSLELLEQEALILENSAIGKINDMTKSCLRCGKCKSVCATHIPEQNLLYSPRDKIIGSNLLIEAFLYEEQTRRGISLSHLAEFDDIADHCTVCHLCVNPCPVNIDFGDVSIKMREMLINKNARKTNLASKLSMFYLNSNGNLTNTIGKKILNLAYFSQRLGYKVFHYFNKPQAKLTIGKPDAFESLITILDKPLPKNISLPNMRDLLDIKDNTNIPILKHPDAPKDCESVFYFPGCGSEKLFSQISLATLALLYHQKVRIILPPSYLCCGYPQVSSGNANLATKITTDNKVLFHRIANSLNYLDITTVLTSCGTCIDQLETYNLSTIFKKSASIDIHEYLLNNGLKLINNNTKYLYHTPCHNPIKNNSADVISEIMGSSIIENKKCCGESGTFAIARPDIAKATKATKQQSIINDLQTMDLTNQEDVQILTTCPACVQGLSRYEDTTGVTAIYPIEIIAKETLGDNWQQDFIDGVNFEKVLL